MSAPLTFLVVDDSKLHHQMYELVFSRGSLAGSTVRYSDGPWRCISHAIRAASA